MLQFWGVKPLFDADQFDKSQNTACWSVFNLCAVLYKNHDCKILEFYT